LLSCREVADFCFDFVEGNLPRDEADRFQAHLARCPGCVTFFSTYKKTPELTREALSTQLPETVRASIRTFLRSRCR